MMKTLILFTIPVMIIGLIAVPIQAQLSVEERLDRLDARVDTLLSLYRSHPDTALKIGLPDDEVNLPWGISGPAGRLLDKRYFLINHNDTWKIPYWVAYYISSSSLKGKAKRTDDFRPDPELASGERAELVDYKRSGYDRGHNAPAADFKRSQAAMSTTFLLSNMCPQAPKLNRYIWEKLEDEVRKAVNDDGEGWIIAGSLFLDKDSSSVAPTKYIGKDSVAVPTHCFKVILLKGEGSGLSAFAFLLPNQKKSIKGKPSQYMLTIDRLEEISGYDFFPALDDSLENRLESTIQTWPR
jgi:endonuclease G